MKKSNNNSMPLDTVHFGQFYLTYLLWPKLKQSKNPRIVCVSSNSHDSIIKTHNMDFTNQHFNNSGYSSYASYSFSKRANIIFSK